MKKVTMEELRHHCTEDDAWMAVRGYVYNITPYLHFHPGGIDELMRGFEARLFALVLSGALDDRLRHILMHFTLGLEPMAHIYSTKCISG